MGPFTIWPWIAVVIIVVLIFRTRGHSFFDMHSRTDTEPVYSAVTIDGKEAEFIGDKLPVRFPIRLIFAIVFGIVVVAYLVFGV